MGYTKGDWKVSEAGDGTIGIRVYQPDWIYPICTIFGSFKQNKANAHLIAASPDLYEALKRGTDALESTFQIIGSEDSFFVKHAQGLLTDMKQALAKARSK